MYLYRQLFFSRIRRRAVYHCIKKEAKSFTTPQLHVDFNCYEKRMPARGQPIKYYSCFRQPKRLATASIHSLMSILIFSWRSGPWVLTPWNSRLLRSFHNAQMISMKRVLKPRFLSLSWSVLRCFHQECSCRGSGKEHWHVIQESVFHHIALV